MEARHEQGWTRAWLLAAALALTCIAGERAALGASITTQCNSALTVTYVSPLVFGSIVPGGAPGTVTVDATGAATASGVTLLPSSVTSAASFSMSTGSVNCKTQSMTISVVSPATLTSGSNTMAVSFPTPPVTAPASGAQFGVNGAPVTLYVGGTLTIGANQLPGYYSGPFTVTVTIP